MPFEAELLMNQELKTAITNIVKNIRHDIRNINHIKNYCKKHVQILSTNTVTVEREKPVDET